MTPHEGIYYYRYQVTFIVKQLLINSEIYEDSCIFEMILRSLIDRYNDGAPAIELISNLEDMIVEGLIGTSDVYGQRKNQRVIKTLEKTF